MLASEATALATPHLVDSKRPPARDSRQLTPPPYHHLRLDVGICVCTDRRTDIARRVSTRLLLAYSLRGLSNALVPTEKLPPEYRFATQKQKANGFNKYARKTDWSFASLFLSIRAHRWWLPWGRHQESYSEGTMESMAKAYRRQRRSCPVHFKCIRTS